MVLYEDLRIYTIWRTDMTRAKQGQEASSEYQKSAEEWEILGELADRLHHPDEAVEAYQACLRVRFSPKAMHGVLKMYDRQGRYQEMLQTMIRLIAWQYRWYSEVSPSPSFCICPTFLTENHSQYTKPQISAYSAADQDSSHLPSSEPSAS